MPDGYSADVSAMGAAVTRHDRAADDVLTAATAVEPGAAGDLGPGVTAAADAVLGAWAARLRSAHGVLARAAGDLRAARDAYAGADDDVRAALPREAR